MFIIEFPTVSGAGYLSHDAGDYDVTYHEGFALVFETQGQAEEVLKNISKLKAFPPNGRIAKVENKG